VCPDDTKYVFDRDQFETWFGNYAAKPVGFSVMSVARGLVKQVTRSLNPKFAVERSPALGQNVYFVFWFPSGPSEFKAEDWQGKVVRLDEATHVDIRKRRVIETALVKARLAMTRKNMSMIATT
jgi:hypothetical protein